MLDRPTLADTAIVEAVRHDYGVEAAEVMFLALGADPNTAVYRLVTPAGDAYFLKLRSGAFDPLSVELPAFLSDRGRVPVIAPCRARGGALWGRLDQFTSILYPFISGQDGFTISLTGAQWHALGSALKGLHTVALPADLRRRLRREDYGPRWRETTLTFLERVERGTWAEPVAAQTADLLRRRRAAIVDLVQRADRLAADLVARQPVEVVCHADIHAGNVLLCADDGLVVVDWDDPILAPKERDLMFIGGGLYGGWRVPEEEEALFYAGYGAADIDARALAYYRYERIVVDIAVYCESLLLTDGGGEDRPVSLRYLASNFERGQTIDLAYRSDRSGFFSPTV